MTVQCTLLLLLLLLLFLLFVVELVMLNVWCLKTVTVRFCAQCIIGQCTSWCSYTRHLKHLFDSLVYYDSQIRS